MTKVYKIMHGVEKVDKENENFFLPRLNENSESPNETDGQLVLNRRLINRDNRGREGKFIQHYKQENAFFCIFASHCSQRVFVSVYQLLISVMCT